MSFSCHSGISELPLETSQENRNIESKLSNAHHHKKRKSSTRDVHIRELFPVSKEIDYIPEFSDCNGKKDSPQFFDQVLLSRISRRPSEDVENRTANHCYELIAREYEFAFQRIEIALQHKETEVAKMKREYEIEISEKEDIIEELKSVYEEQLKNQDTNLGKLNSELQRLEQKIKEQQIQIGVLKSDKQIAQANFRRAEREHEGKMDCASRTISQLENALSEFNSILADKNNKISEIQKLSLNSAVSKDTEKPMVINVNTANSFEQNLIKRYKNEVQSYKIAEKHLLAKLTVQQHQIAELKQYKLSYLQSSALLDDNLKVTNSMASEIFTLKSDLKTKDDQQQILRAIIQGQKSNISKLSFENQNLNNYNKVLLTNKEEKPKQNKFAMSRLRKENSLLLPTKLFS